MYPELKALVIDVCHVADLIPAVASELGVIEGVQKAVNNEPWLIASAPMDLIESVIGEPLWVVCNLMALRASREG